MYLKYEQFNAVKPVWVAGRRSVWLKTSDRLQLRHFTAGFQHIR